MIKETTVSMFLLMVIRGRGGDRFMGGSVAEDPLD